MLVRPPSLYFCAPLAGNSVTLPVHGATLCNKTLLCCWRRSAPARGQLQPVDWPPSELEAAIYESSEPSNCDLCLQEGKMRARPVLWDDLALKALPDWWERVDEGTTLQLFDLMNRACVLCSQADSGLAGGRPGMAEVLLHGAGSRLRAARSGGAGAAGSHPDARAAVWLDDAEGVPPAQRVRVHPALRGARLARRGPSPPLGLLQHSSYLTAQESAPLRRCAPCGLCGQRACLYDGSLLVRFCVTRQQVQHAHCALRSCGKRLVGDCACGTLCGLSQVHTPHVKHPKSHVYLASAALCCVLIMICTLYLALVRR